MESGETESKKENWKKISKKRKAKATFATIPNKFQLKHPYSKRAGTTADMMKQFYCARVSLGDMEKDYTFVIQQSHDKPHNSHMENHIIVT